MRQGLRRASSLFVFLLALSGAAFGQYSAVLAGTTVTFTGTAVDSSIVFDSSGGLLRHNLFTQGVTGFNSNFDFDSTVAGDQTLSASDATVTVVVNAGGGSDTVALTAAVAAAFVL